MTRHHEKEEEKLKVIIYNHVHPSNENSKVNVNIYYRNLKLKNLLINNSLPSESEAKDHYVYRYTCDERQCNLSYIGCGMLLVLYFSHFECSKCLLFYKTMKISD